ncbi:hypothetical protein MG293_000021 [Ovis ammon polii]|uniref:Uncharacterized protein n=1 Tax=Ovis ammon polii TaxID=230172 RepID=A0AAD4YI30_OVIAM|nr:hypothetical protein MG293_000021 [Ovis ammon polii]
MPVVFLGAPGCLKRVVLTTAFADGYMGRVNSPLVKKSYVDKLSNELMDKGGCACVLHQFSHVRLCGSMDCSPPGSSIHGVTQARILEWVAVPSPRDRSDLGTEPASLTSPALADGINLLKTDYTLRCFMAKSSIKTFSQHVNGTESSQVRVAQEFGEHDRRGLSHFLPLLLSFLGGPLAHPMRQIVTVQHPQKS